MYIEGACCETIGQRLGGEDAVVAHRGCVIIECLVEGTGIVPEPVKLGLPCLLHLLAVGLDGSGEGGGDDRWLLVD